MNKERRNELSKAFSLIEEAKAIIEQCASDEQDAFDSMPEGLQNSERGERAQEACDALSECESSLEDALASIETAQGE